MEFQASGSIRKPSFATTTAPEENISGLKHCKCRIVKLIRGQMARLDKNRELQNNLRSRIQNMSIVYKK